MSNLFKQILSNVTTRIMFIIYMSIILVTAFFIIFGYINQLNLHEKKEYEKLTALSSSLAINIDGDAHQMLMETHPWKGDIENVQEDSNYYKIHEMLHEVQDQNELHDVLYTLVYNEDEQVFYYGVRSDTFMDFRGQYEMFPEILIEKMETGGIIPRYRSENGEYLSAFYPIRNSQGNVVALLEADVEFSRFRTIVFNHYKNEALISLGVILLMALFLIPYARKILREEEKITHEIVEQKRIIEIKNRDITDSINYARKIQEALLPHEEHISESLPKSFVYYKPRDIVSGDFYWFKEMGDHVLLAAIDCTGHGIPGALMSMIGHSKLNAITSSSDETDPGIVLDRLDQAVTSALSSKKYSTESKDGMDVSLCSIDPKNKKLRFAGAFRPLVIINGDSIEEIKGNRFPIGGGSSYEKHNYTTHEIDIKEGDSFYMYSDGYPDQFGGPKEKKFMNKKFKLLLQSIQHLSPEEQVKKLDDHLVEWQGDNEQVDDVLVIGVGF